MFPHAKSSALLILVTALFLVAPAAATTITVTLDDVTQSNCDTPWMESGCALWFTETTAEDLTSGFCLVLPDANNFGLEGVYLWPGRLVLDLSGVLGLQTVEVDIYETHFAGSTRARLYREGSQVYYAPSFQEDAQTLVLDNVGQNADQLVISAHEAYVWEIRLIGPSIVSDSATSFGLIKSRY